MLYYVFLHFLILCVSQESSSGLLQSTLLNQVRIVWKGQLLTAWISNSLPIILQVGKISISSCLDYKEQYVLCPSILSGFQVIWNPMLVLAV